MSNCSNHKKKVVNVVWNQNELWMNHMVAQIHKTHGHGLVLEDTIFSLLINHTKARSKWLFFLKLLNGNLKTPNLQVSSLKSSLLFHFTFGSKVFKSCNPWKI
jgi:hypothetical protein